MAAGGAHTPPPLHPLCRSQLPNKWSRSSPRASPVPSATSSSTTSTMPLGIEAITRAVTKRARRGLYAGKRVLTGNNISDDGGNKCVVLWSGAGLRGAAVASAAASCSSLCSVLVRWCSTPDTLGPCPCCQDAARVEAQLPEQAAVQRDPGSHGAAASHRCRAAVSGWADALAGCASSHCGCLLRLLLLPASPVLGQPSHGRSSP